VGCGRESGIRPRYDSVIACDKREAFARGSHRAALCADRLVRNDG